MRRIPLAITEHRCPCGAAQQIKQAMPQMLGTGPMVPPQGMAQQQDICSLPHWKEMMPQ